tara:strand:+ start:329 stop:2494 length:2166 start_codon:yes stop_codon:yes gene_type:complete
MKFKFLLLISLFLHCKQIPEEVPFLPMKIVIDSLYGVKIIDAYRYIENLEDTLALKWYKQQTNFSNKLVSSISNRDQFISLQQKINSSDNIKISKLKITSNNIYFYLKEDKNHNIKKLFYRNSFNGDEKLLFNPISISENTVINYINPNWNGTQIIIGITENDNEIGEIIILDIESKKLLDQPISNCWPSALGGARWLPDNTGFTYEFIPEIDKDSEKYLLNIQTLLHKVSQNPKTDKILLSKNNNPNIKIKEQDFPEVAFKDETSNYMFASISGASYYADYYYSNLSGLRNLNIEWKKLFTKEKLIKKFYVDNDDIIYLTAENAENFKLCKTSLLKPNFEKPEILVTQDSNYVITDFTLTSKGVFFVKTKNGVEAKLYQFTNEKKIIEIAIPEKSGNIDVSSKGSNYDDLWIKTKGWTSQKEEFKYDYSNNRFVAHQLYPNTIYKELLSNTVIKELEVYSDDNETIPLSIIYKKGTKLDGNSSVLLNGYGAFGISIKPALSSYLLHWINNGGIYAVAHVRGGGEKGNSWYKGGYKKTKPNSWKDLISCTEYLIKNKYTSQKKIALSSASGGGVLIGNAIVERPDLFAAAIIRVGIFNTLRSEFAPNGKNLIREFGTVSDSLEFKYLLEMDAYYKIKKNIEYPAVYLTAGLNDSRVVVWQPGKFAAKLQESTSSNMPILLSVNFDGGHGFDASKETKDEELANLLSFAFWQTGHPDFQPRQ